MLLITLRMVGNFSYYWNPLHSIDSRLGWAAIESMRVRGAPAIAIAGALSLAVEAHALVEGGHTLSNPSAAADYLSEKLDYLTTSRPTAVNLSEAATRLSAFVRSQVSFLPATAEGASQLLGCYIEEAERFVIEW